MLKTFFKNIDLFGVHLENKVDSNQNVYKSFIGGITSLIIFSASLAYAVWVFYQWGTNQFTAKITSSIYASDFSLLDMDYEVVKINFWNDQYGELDPFKENILIPLVTYTQNYTNPETHVLGVSNETAYSGTNYMLPKIKLGFTNVDGDFMTTSEMFIKIIKCTPALLPAGQECASEEKISKFFQEPLNTIIMEVHYKQLDSKDGSIQSSVQELLIQFENENCYTLNIFLQTTFYEVKSSLLFSTPDNYEFINGAFLQTQTNSLDYCRISYEYETYLVFYIAMKGNQIKTSFEYPSLGDLLANIGSIISLLFMIRHFIFILNSQLLNHKLIHEVISFYYPQFKKIKIKKNWRFQIKKVFLQNELVDTEEFIKFYNKVYKQVSQKLTYTNIIYELSRIQIILRQRLSSEEIKNSHQFGIPLDNLLVKNLIRRSSVQLRMSSDDNNFEKINLSDGEIGVLSLTKRNLVP